MNAGCQDWVVLGTLCLESRVIFRLISCIGVAAFTLPESVPWSLALCITAAILNVLAVTNHRSKLIALVISTSVTLAATSVLIPASIATAILAALALAPRFPYISISILVLQTSYAASFEALLSDWLHVANLESAAPALIACLIISVIQPTLRFKKLILLVAPVFLVHLGNSVVTSAWILMTIAAVPALALAVLAPSITKNENHQTWSLSVVVILSLFGTMGWVITPPRTPDSAYVFLPSAPQAPEADLYRNYASVLKFTDLDIKVVNSLEHIPVNALLLLPWLTVPINDTEDRDLIPQIKKLAESRKWTVILIGEHTNIRGIGDRVSALVGYRALRNDLTTPAKNTDYSDPLRVGDFRAWPHNSILNRGASISISSPNDRILLAGDAWWAEPDIGEWLWVGDYRWQPSDRNGRLTLGASIHRDGARWVVIGDTSPFTNQQLVSDPRAVNAIIQMSTLWPLFIRDLWLFLFSILCVTAHRIIASNKRWLIVFLNSIILVPIIFIIVTLEAEAPWRSAWLQESGFNERNFNKMIANNPEFGISEWKLIRLKNELSGIYNPPRGKSIIFGIVDTQVDIGPVSLNRCHRIGSIESDEGPYLMDSQACLVSGNAEILMGDSEGAAAIRIKNDDHEAIIILDRKFLSQKAPTKNSTWLLGKMGV